LDMRTYCMSYVTIVASAGKLISSHFPFPAGVKYFFPP
jgi:hypothetical protein